jgi:hypothetical protein
MRIGSAQGSNDYLAGIDTDSDFERRIARLTQAS